MIYIAGAFVVSLLSVLVPLVLFRHLNVSEYIDLSMMCGVLGENDGTCKTGALSAGYTMLAGLAIGLVLAIAFNKKFSRSADNAVDTKFAFGWCLLATVLLLGTHIAVEAFGANELTRIREIGQFSSFISLENLLWPLLLQLMNSSRTVKLRLMYFALLLPIVSLSPYRGVLLSVLTFGLGLPIIAGVIEKEIQWKALLRQRQLMAGSILGLFVVVLLLFAMYQDTRNRTTEIVEGQAQSESQAKLTQRLAYPIFQGYFAERIASLERLPTVGDEILHKFRLGTGQNLNENLYSKVYGDGTVGEMTSLYYGEAAANSMSNPIIWIVVGPMLLVAIWQILGRFGYEVGTLIGIAIWRGSLGGVASVIPSLVLQIFAFALLLRRSKRD